MADFATDGLTYEEFERWRSQLRIDWDELLRKLAVKPDQKHVIKNRWGDNPKQMAALIDVLSARESARVKRTPMGERLLRLEQWNKAGRVLARDESVFADELARVRERAAEVEELIPDAVDKDAEAAFGDPLTKPTKARK